MDIIEAVENHIAEYKALKERHATLLENYNTIEKWLAVALGKAGGKIELLERETFEQFQTGGGVAFGARECHYFDYYNAEAGRTPQARPGQDSGCAADRIDALRYRALKASNKYSPDRFGGWGLSSGNAKWTERELDEAADALVSKYNAPDGGVGDEPCWSGGCSQDSEAT